MANDTDSPRNTAEPGQPHTEAIDDPPFPLIPDTNIEGFGKKTVQDNNKSDSNISESVNEVEEIEEDASVEENPHSHSTEMFKVNIRPQRDQVNIYTDFRDSDGFAAVTRKASRRVPNDTGNQKLNALSSTRAKKSTTKKLKFTRAKPTKGGDPADYGDNEDDLPLSRQVFPADAPEYGKDLFWTCHVPDVEFVKRFVDITQAYGRLRTMTQLRPVEVRGSLDKEGNFVYVELQLSRTQHLEGMMGYMIGKETSRPCSNKCAKGAGKFARCIRMTGFFKGACVCCHYAAEGNLCEYHVSRQLNTTAPSTTRKRPAPADPASASPYKRPHNKQEAKIQKQDLDLPSPNNMSDSSIDPYHMASESEEILPVTRTDSSGKRWLPSIGLDFALNMEISPDDIRERCRQSKLITDSTHEVLEKTTEHFQQIHHNFKQMGHNFKEIAHDLKQIQNLCEKIETINYFNHVNARVLDDDNKGYSVDYEPNGSFGEERYLGFERRYGGNNRGYDSEDGGYGADGREYDTDRRGDNGGYGIKKSGKNSGPGGKHGKLDSRSGKWIDEADDVNDMPSKIWARRDPGSNRRKAKTNSPVGRQHAEPRNRYARNELTSSTRRHQTQAASSLTFHANARKSTGYLRKLDLDFDI